MRLFPQSDPIEISGVSIISNNPDKFFSRFDADYEAINSNPEGRDQSGVSDVCDIEFGTIVNHTGKSDADDPGIYGDMETKQFIDKLLERELTGAETRSKSEDDPATGDLAADESALREEKGVRETEESEDSPVIRLEAYDWVQCVVSTVIVVILIFFFGARQISVDGVSMMDTLHHTDRLLVTTLYGQPDSGDIIILHTESFQSPLVKRVIATAGQTLEFDFDLNRVKVDGEYIDESYIRGGTMHGTWIDWDQTEYLNEAGQLVVPDGYVFVMGDNRNNSLDSRKSNVGFVDTRNIVGIVRLIVIPGADEYGSRDWSRFGFVK